MASFNYDNRKTLASAYEPEVSTDMYSCQGSCTCNLGYRTTYDAIQIQNSLNGNNIVNSYPASGYVPGWPRY